MVVSGSARLQNQSGQPGGKPGLLLPGFFARMDSAGHDDGSDDQRAHPRLSSKTPLTSKTCCAAASPTLAADRALFSLSPKLCSDPPPGSPAPPPEPMSHHGDVESAPVAPAAAQGDAEPVIARGSAQ